MLRNVEFSVTIDDSSVTNDEIMYASTRSLNRFVRQNSNEDAVIEKVINGVTRKFEILTFNAELDPDFVGKRSVEFIFHIAQSNNKFSGIDDFVDSMVDSVIKLIAEQLEISSDTIELSSMMMSGGIEINDVDLYKPNGNHWFRAPYQWTTNESNEVADRIRHGEGVDAVISEINGRKNEIMPLNTHYVYDTANNRHKETPLFLKSKQDGLSLSPVSKSTKKDTAGFFEKMLGTR